MTKAILKELEDKLLADKFEEAIDALVALTGENIKVKSHLMAYKQTFRRLKTKEQIGIITVNELDNQLEVLSIKIFNQLYLLQRADNDIQ